MAANHPDERRPASESGDSRSRLPQSAGGTGHPAPAEARAEFRDRETYYAELRFAVHCQSRSLPAPQIAGDDMGSGTGTPRGAIPGGESWDDLIARFGDTWT